MELWKQGIKQSTNYAMKMNPYVDYQEDILLHLSKPLLGQGCIFLEDFWPFSNWKLNYVKTKLSSIMSVGDSKDLVIRPYCGPKNLKLVPTYTPFRILNNGDFILVKLHDPFLILIWLGTQSDVFKDDPNEFFIMVRVEWWVLMKKGSNLDEQCLYEDCWNGKWKCNLADLEYWFKIVVVLFSFLS